METKTKPRKGLTTVGNQEAHVTKLGPVQDALGREATKYAREKLGFGRALGQEGQPGGYRAWSGSPGRRGLAGAAGRAGLPARLAWQLRATPDP